MARAVLQTIALGAVLALALFVPAQRITWPTAWGFLLFYTGFSIAGFALLPRELLLERSRIPADANPTDLAIGGLAFVLLLPGTLLVSGFDARWTASPPLPAALRAAALAVFALGYAISLWAAHANPFFSAVVRIQSERGHRVVASGPYAFVRHPGYAGPLMGHLALPIALGTLWGFVPTALGALFLVLRIGLEERKLVRDLPGYAAYRERVRWRLVPGIW